MARQRDLGPAGNAWDQNDSLPTEDGGASQYAADVIRVLDPGLDEEVAYGAYLSSYQRAEHVLTQDMPLQTSISSPVDVSGNGSAMVFANSQGDIELLQDPAGGDLEDANLLLAGAANLISTRSDTFVAHFRVRSFKQNSETGLWDATDPRFIVDERRFVMLIDRSNVDEPGQAPDILFLEEAPN